MLDPKFQKEDAEATCRGICKTFNVAYEQPEKSVWTEKDVKFVKVLFDGLNIRKSPSWDDLAVVGTVKKGEVFTVVKKVKAGDSYMYELKSGLYITASRKYVEEL